MINPDNFKESTMKCEVKHQSHVNKVSMMDETRKLMIITHLVKCT